MVPDDTVDNGEQDKVHDVLSGEGLDLSYLWMVDKRNLGSPSRPTSNTEGSSCSATEERGTTTSTTDIQVVGAHTWAACDTSFGTPALSLDRDLLSSSRSGKVCAGISCNLNIHRML